MKRWHIMANLNSQSLTSTVVPKYSKLSRLIANIRVELDQAKIKFLIIFVFFVFTGLTSVISQKYLNQILELSGIQLKTPLTPSMTSFLKDFLGNLGIYVLIIIIFGGGTFSNEVEINKQVYFLLSRPISRSTYYLTRSIILSAGMAITTLLSSFVVYFYANLYFEPLDIGTISWIFLLTSLQYSSMYAFMIMYSAKYNQVTAWVLGILTYVSGSVIAFLTQFYDPLKWLSPFYLSNDFINILNGSLKAVDLTEYFIVLVVIWTILPILIGWFFYRRHDL